MSTRCSIAVQYPDGSVAAVYCHFDGYLDGVGERLLTYYDSRKQAEEIVKGGGMSSLGVSGPIYHHSLSLGTRSYDNFTQYEANVGEDIHDNGFQYIYIYDHWYVRQRFGDTQFKDLFIKVELALGEGWKNWLKESGSC